MNVYETFELVHRGSIDDWWSGIVRSEGVETKLFCAVLERLEEVQNGAIVQCATQPLVRNICQGLGRLLEKQHVSRAMRVLEHLWGQSIRPVK
jgi:hypothetical protein